MSTANDDLRIQSLETLSPPSLVIGEALATSRIAETVGDARRAAHHILAMAATTGSSWSSGPAA